MAVAYPNVRKKSDDACASKSLVLTRRDDLFIRGLMQCFRRPVLRRERKTPEYPTCLSVEKVYDYFDKCPKSPAAKRGRADRPRRNAASPDMSSERLPEAPTASPIQTSFIASHLGAIG